MTNREFPPGQNIRFLTLVPDIASFYTFGEIIAQARTLGPDPEVLRDMTIVFDCTDLFSLSEKKRKDPESFLPWCFLRCVDVARKLQVCSLDVVCSKDAWLWLKPLWAIACGSLVCRIRTSGKKADF